MGRVIEGWILPRLAAGDFLIGWGPVWSLPGTKWGGVGIERWFERGGWGEIVESGSRGENDG